SPAGPAGSESSLWAAEGSAPAGFRAGGTLSRPVGARRQEAIRTRLCARAGRRRRGRAGLWFAGVSERGAAAGVRFVFPACGAREATARGGFGGHWGRRHRSLDADGEGGGPSRTALPPVEHPLHWLGRHGERQSRRRGALHAGIRTDGADYRRASQSETSLLAGAVGADGGGSEIRRPKTEGRKKAEDRRPKRA